MSRLVVKVQILKAWAGEVVKGVSARLEAKKTATFAFMPIAFIKLLIDIIQETQFEVSLVSYLSRSKI